jgi:tetratricopeptide (TPR) repeat protein
MHTIKGARRCLAPFLFILFCFTLPGCAHYQQSRAILSAVPADLPLSHLIENTPFVAQEDFFCGPSAMSMMLQAQGLNPDLDELVSMVYVPERQGSFQIELKAAARRYELLPYELDPTLESVLREVAAGNPVLVLQNLGLTFSPTWHYAVVIGYDLLEKEVILHSGMEAQTRMLLTTFERTWIHYSSAWALTVMPPEKIPATANPFAFQKALEDLVSVGLSRPALTGYEAARNRWSENTLHAVGFANLLYQQQDFVRSAEQFLHAIELDPEHLPAWNNMAYALSNLGCENAIDAAQCAIKLAPESASVKSTLSDVQTQLESRKSAVQTCPNLPLCPPN